MFVVSFVQPRCVILRNIFFPVVPARTTPAPLLPSSFLRVFVRFFSPLPERSAGTAKKITKRFDKEYSEFQKNDKTAKLTKEIKTLEGKIAQLKVRAGSFFHA